ncbi:unnamed protein product [Mytilus edulis]|uniref:Uncharacterized protein n=1 Tax=Mytilus edulis TaxID=6550 RepID=A0A8S3SLB8_MYTED|nr:unnamed protein product [Mytilus edulis]
MRALVYEHCKKLLENLMLLAAQDNENVARTLLQYRSNITDTLTLIAEDRDIHGALAESGGEEVMLRSMISVDSSQFKGQIGKQNTKLELPPRYSDIYPQSELSTSTSADKASLRRNDSTRSSSLYGSLFRSSNIRNAFRRGQVTDPASFEKNLSIKSTQKFIKSNDKVSDNKPLASDNSFNQTRRHSTTHTNYHPERSSLMSSIAASLPSLFSPSEM